MLKIFDNSFTFKLFRTHLGSKEIDKILLNYESKILIVKRRPIDIFISLKKAIKICQSPIIQEYLEGDEYTCGSIFLKNKLISVICLRRFLKDGNTSIAFLENNFLLTKYIS